MRWKLWILVNMRSRPISVYVASSSFLRYNNFHHFFRCCLLLFSWCGPYQSISMCLLPLYVIRHPLCIFIFFIPPLSRHLGSPVYMLICHAALFVALSSFSPASVISLLHASLNFKLGRPLLLFTGTCPHLVLFSLSAPLFFDLLFG